MRVSLRWLEDYVAVKLPVAELAHRLTMAGIEVAQVIQIGDFWSNTFVGTVVELSRHPNADRLQLVMVDYGQADQPTFVTGAMNIAVGDKVPVALLGADSMMPTAIHRSASRSSPWCCGGSSPKAWCARPESSAWAMTMKAS